MKTTRILLTAPLLLAACGSTTEVYDPDSEGIRTVDEINYNDFVDASGVLVQSLLGSGALDDPGLSKHTDGRVIMALEDVDNLTANHLQSQVLTDKLRISLNTSGKVFTTTAVKFGKGGPEDVGTEQVRTGEGTNPTIMEDNPYQATVRYPDVSLSGHVTQLTAEEGRTKESVVIFKLTLTDLRSGLAIWEDEAPVGTRRTRGLFGS